MLMLNPKVVREFWTFMAISAIVGAHYHTTGILFVLILAVAVTVIQAGSAACYHKEAELAKATTNNKKRK